MDAEDVRRGGGCGLVLLGLAIIYAGIGWLIGRLLGAW